jgi:hypothetical protein
VREFLGLGLTEDRPDHSTISRTRGLIDWDNPSGGVHAGRAMSWDRQTYLRGLGNILKRLLVHAAGCNLCLRMRRLIGCERCAFRRAPGGSKIADLDSIRAPL